MVLQIVVSRIHVILFVAEVAKNAEILLVFNGIKGMNKVLAITAIKTVSLGAYTAIA